MGLNSKIQNNSYNSTAKKKPIDKWAEDLNRHLSKARHTDGQSLQITNAGEGVEKRNPPTLLVGM